MASPLRTTAAAMDVKHKETDFKSDVKQNVKDDKQTNEDKGAKETTQNPRASASKRTPDLKETETSSEEEDQDDGEGEEEEPSKPLTKTERSKREKVFLISIAFYASRLGRFFGDASTSASQRWSHSKRIY